MPDTDPRPETTAGPRQTLAMRLAERAGQRELRAARLARLRTAAPQGPAAAAPGGPDPAVLEIYLPPAPAAAMPAAGGLDRLPGAGPGLVAALRRAGLERLADLAGLEPATLGARLGPLGRLIPAGRWIAFARAEAGPQDAAAEDARADSVPVP